MIGAGYIRVSLEEMAERGISLDMQEAEVRRYTERQGIELISMICDPGRSGKDLNRQGIQDLIGLIDSKNIDTVICWRQDRLTRNVIDAMNLSDFFRRHGVTLHTVCDSRLETDTADGEFTYGLKALLDQRERKLISERTRSAMHRKRERGERISGRAPYGYRFVGSQVVQDEREQSIIRTVLVLSDQGISIRRIAQKLADPGNMNRAGRPFGKTELHKIITSQAA